MDQQRAGSVLSRPTSFTMPLPQRDTFQHPQRIHQVDRQSLEESLKRSITLVFWYKPLFEPIRLNQEISTFPLFQLAQFSQLISDLGVNPSDYVDSYNPYSGHWEQQAISTVRAVESEQRLLYRIRKTFLDGLTEDECPGLREEVGLQMRPHMSHTPLYGSPVSATSPPAIKRPAPDNNDQITKYYRMDYAGNAGSSQAYVTTNSMQQYAPPPPSQAYPTPPSYHAALATKHTPPSGAFTYAASAKDANVSPSMQSPNAVSFPHHPHPPLKRWPNDYTVSEVSAGFKQMDAMIAQQPTLTQRTAFEKVFGCRYVKSTVCRHRGVWRRADEATKTLFEGMGTDERAVWGDFVKQVEGRRKSDGQTTTAAAAAATRHAQRHNIMHEMQFAPGIQMISGRHIMNVSPPAAGVSHSPTDRSSSEYQTSGGDSGGGGAGPEVIDLDEPVMGSLGPPPPRMHQNPQLPPDDTSQQQTLGVVDSSLTHIPQTDHSE